MRNITTHQYSSERLSDKYLVVNSCGIESLDQIDRGSIRPSGRVDYHILYIEKGVCRLIAGGREVEVHEGGFVLFRPGEPQIYRFQATDRSVSHYAHFTGSGCRELIDTLGIGGMTLFDMGRSRSYEQLSAKMTREFIMRQPLWENWCSVYLHGLLNIIARKYSLRNGNVSYASEGRINRACLSIYENLASPPELSELCAAACLSESRFTHIFKQATGKSVAEYTRFMRMNRAKELLGTTELSIREISELIGYEDQNYFSRVFKNEEGVSPRTYRELYKQT